jgi:imidazoleglycerol-phosphate dehydratase/histidinol-phosphatase
MKKIIFLDRDGTIILEPKLDKQVDSFKKLSFIPGMIKYLEKINNELGFDIVLVTNQDGLGTESFPEESFWPIQNFIVDTLKNENINFIDLPL